MKKSIIYIVLILSIWNCRPDKSFHNYILDESRSVVEWTGYLRNGDSNSGTIAVKSDSFLIKNGKVQAGSFSFPLSSLNNTNLTTDELKDELIQRLQSPDFFDMALDPKINFVITKAVTYPGSGQKMKDGIPGTQYLVSGNLTILEKTNPVSFPAKIVLENDSVAVEGKLKIDRTKWGMTIASDDSSPDSLYIKPEIDLHIKLFGSKI
ncbi:YceI family protein [Dyadobacter sp. NIV53]|uniref:YceI family protein n=1 Tax=Dyadobacter sp. NIV53 TaxID=2861765 RepID=UPI001C88DE52|nr:YceI family protein [Dyadobacter sp. NIV53]